MCPQDFQKNSISHTMLTEHLVSIINLSRRRHIFVWNLEQLQVLREDSKVDVLYISMAARLSHLLSPCSLQFWFWQHFEAELIDKNLKSISCKTTEIKTWEEYQKSAILLVKSNSARTEYSLCLPALTGSKRNSLIHTFLNVSSPVHNYMLLVRV